MIVSTFTREEFFDYLRKHRVGINNLFLNLNFKWNKAVREYKGGSISVWMDGVYENNRYAIFRNARDKKEAVECSNVSYLCFVPVASGKYQIYEWFSNGRLKIFSSHFFERYEERMKISGSLDKAIKMFHKHSNAQIYLLNKDDRFVLANDQGLTLGVKRDDTEVCCTFVDYSLLKASQKAAFDKAMPYLKEVFEKSRKLFMSGVDTFDAESLCNKLYDDVCNEIEDIYAEYFNSKDLV